jgi:hypothetical protein
MTGEPQPKRRRGRPTVQIILSEDERQTLERWARRPTSSQALALRCRIVLACGEGLSNVEAGTRLGAPRTITDQQVEQVITKTLEKTPTDATHWSTWEMARVTGMSQTAIVRIWRAFGLKPHLDEAWKLSTDPQFIDKVRDLVGLYLSPPQAAVVLCVDEKSQIQALDRTAPVLPLLPGTPQRRSSRVAWWQCGRRFGLPSPDLASGDRSLPWPRRAQSTRFLIWRLALRPRTLCLRPVT